MSYVLDDYLNLFAAQHRQQPDLIAMASAVLNPLISLQQTLESIVPQFDLDVAIGAQLDVLGQWVGVSRQVNIPISGVFFSWDGVDSSVGWDFGTWIGANDPSTITTLPDDTYRTLIRARIAANKWDGTTNGAYTAWESAFPTLNILIQDNLNMSYDLIVVGEIVDSLTQAIITGGYIPLKPEGVRVANYWFPVDTNPIFGWNVESTLMKGWNEGSWALRIGA